MGDSPNELFNLSWKDSDIDSSLKILCRFVESAAQAELGWYERKRKIRAQISTTLRFAAILLFVFGGLVPIVKATLSPESMRSIPFDFGQAGYLFIGIAAGCVGMDRFFGYSTGWIRYSTTALALEKSLDEFRMEWARDIAKLRGAAPDENQLDRLILTCETFVVAIREQVEQETKAWIVEFQGTLAQLEKDLQSKSDEVKARTLRLRGDS
jgi:hypothetical protein